MVIKISHYYTQNYQIFICTFEFHSLLSMHFLVPFVNIWSSATEDFGSYSRMLGMGSNIFGYKAHEHINCSKELVHVIIYKCWKFKTDWMRHSCVMSYIKFKSWRKKKKFWQPLKGPLSRLPNKLNSINFLGYHE